ncbi:DUF2593 family protein [Salmonella enterica subsp. enterica]|nr:DUF2593 family protein [Salmonella enterica subsp. enterica]
MLVFVEIVVRFRWVKAVAGRAGYFGDTNCVSGHLWAASLGYGYPELFSIAEIEA